MDERLTQHFRAAIADYVRRVAVVQGELLALYRRKRAALAASLINELRQCEQVEQQLIGQLQNLTAERMNMLSQAQRMGLECQNLTEIARIIGVEPATMTEHRNCHDRAELLRQEGLVQWVVARRLAAQSAEMLEIIAQGGKIRKSTYGRNAASEETTSGGRLLDAMA